MPRTLIIGAGLTGLSVGYFLKKDYLILEREDMPGGLCRSVHLNGYTFDYSGHFLHLHNEKTKRLIGRLLGDNIEKINRDTWIYEFSRFIPFPFQANLSFLPEKIRKECLDGFYNRKKTSRKDFYDWSVSAFGKGITKYFLKPYNEKLWTVPAKELGSDWAAPFVPVPSRKEIEAGAVRRADKPFGYNASFFYPRNGGIGSLIKAFSEKSQFTRLGTASEAIDTEKKTVEASDGKNYYYENLVSTQPLPKLLKSIKDLPKRISSAAEKLRWNSVDCLNVGIKNDTENEKLADGRHWIYFPEKKFPFYRAGFYKNIVQSSCPAGASSMYIEISRKPGKKADKKGLLKESLNALKSIGILKGKDMPDAVNILEMPYAYVIYDSNRIQALKTIFDFLKTKGIHSIGRYGSWEYSFMEKSILEAEKTARKIESLQTK